MDQGATETDLIPNKQEENILNPTNLLKFLIHEPINGNTIGHFRVPLCLCFKASLSAKPFL